MKKITGRKLLMTASVFFAAFIVTTGNVWAQSRHAYLHKADQLYASGDYYGAAQCYAIWLDSANVTGKLMASPFTVKQRDNSKQVSAGGTTSRAEAMWRLADCYRACRDYGKMEPAYKSVAVEHSKRYPEAAYWYGCALRANGKLDEAETVLNNFLRENRSSLTGEAARRELNNIAFARQQLKRTSPGYEVSKVSGANGYAPLLTGGRINFTAADTMGKGPFYNQLFTGHFENGMISGAEKILALSAERKHTGMAALSPDGHTIYFTQWETREGKTLAVIMSSREVEGKWSAPVKMGTSVNQGGSNSRDPFVSADGKYLLFSSDRKGGAGGYDIWCTLLSGEGKAWNLAAVNTAGDEQAPVYNVQQQQLIFSSNGLTGMGGFDLYQSSGLPEQLQTPINMGFPVNTVRDDMYFTEDPKNALLSSDRAVDCCLELYTVRNLSTPWLVQGRVNDCATGEGIAAAQLSIKDSLKQSLLTTTTTSAVGLYNIAMDNPAWLQFTATKDGYQPADYTVYVQRRPDLDTVSLSAICLTQLTVTVPDSARKTDIVWPVIYFAFDKAGLSREAKGQLDSLATHMQQDPSLAIDIKGYTDSRGTESYNKRLSERRASACVAYLQKKGIAASRLRSEGLGKCCPVADDLADPTEAGRNRRVEVVGLSDRF